MYMIYARRRLTAARVHFHDLVRKQKSHNINRVYQIIISRPGNIMVLLVVLLGV